MVKNTVIFFVRNISYKNFRYINIIIFSADERKFITFYFKIFVMNYIWVVFIYFWLYQIQLCIKFVLDIHHIKSFGLSRKYYNLLALNSLLLNILYFFLVCFILQQKSLFSTQSNWLLYLTNERTCLNFWIQI